jgi:hypothetical protein
MPAFTAAGVLSNSVLDFELKHRPSQIGMVMVMMPGDGGNTHKRAVYQI